MENKKYLDKVIGSFIRGTKINYENKEVITPFNVQIPFSFVNHLVLSLSFSSYCKNTFGLTDDEVEYVWEEYRNIINGKIENEG